MFSFFKLFAHPNDLDYSFQPYIGIGYRLKIEHDNKPNKSHQRTERRTISTEEHFKTRRSNGKRKWILKNIENMVSHRLFISYMLLFFFCVCKYCNRDVEVLSIYVNVLNYKMVCRHRSGSNGTISKRCDRVILHCICPCKQISIECRFVNEFWFLVFFFSSFFLTPSNIERVLYVVCIIFIFQLFIQCVNMNLWSETLDYLFDCLFVNFIICWCGVRGIFFCIVRSAD